eukprot:TRINITY_DN6238_c0_g1_i1.p1 TRINITY_DN6238_c0_g1~~TRINITY_DN6238_c0_g1_i1.p1  ORF type:complete len:901 (+),score=180.15 TRINITY_DN6238_c0_g1_i1:57-2759(+)
MDKAGGAAGDAAASASSKAPPAVANPDDEDVSREVYLGVVKSYNDRRGFGFLACTETADQFGRDVYMPKAEATLAALQAAGVDRETGVSMVASGNTSAAATAAAAAAAPRGPQAAKAAAAAAQPPEKKESEGGEKAPPAPRLAEEDLVLFRVRRSIEGYPQAVCVQRLRKITGNVLRAPAPDAPRGAIASDEATPICGKREVPFERAACGQVRLMPGDEVTFCLPEAARGIDGAGVSPAAPSSEPQAKMVFLSRMDRANGSVLGCFTLDLPRTRPAPADGAPALPPSDQPNLKLPCHAFGDKLILAGLPPDLDEGELMRFFSKQGASGTIVAHARACSFASVSFQSTADVSRFLGRTAHAFADDKDTLIARLLPLAPGSENAATLPALPSPTLSTSSKNEELEAGSLLVVWSPLVLAVAYSVELRPAGSQGAWATVDVASRRLGTTSNRFDSNCSSCRVTGLQLNTAYEARVSYFTECGTCSEASEASEPCMPASSGGALAPRDPAAFPEAAPVPGTSPALLGHAGLGVAEGFSSASNSVPPPFAAPGSLAPALGAPPPVLPGMPPAPPTWPAWGGHPGPEPFQPGLLPPPLPPPVAMHDPAAAAAAAAGYPVAPGAPPTWRSPSGLVVPPPATPELRPGDEFGFAVSVQWPAVLQAAAYVVELREAGTTAFERFVRSAPEAKLGTLVELRVGGLRPGPPPGRVYMAQVRTVGADGSESAPSPPGWSPPLPSVEAGGGAPPPSGETVLLSTAGGPPAAEAMPVTSHLSADAAPWQPTGLLPPEGQPADGGVAGWAPPPWLSSQPPPDQQLLVVPPPVVPPQGLPAVAEAPALGPGEGTAPGPEKSWGTLGVPPPPPAGPPALGGAVASAAARAAAASGDDAADGAQQGGSTAQAECLILD